MIIRERIFELLREKGMTQREFSKLTGIAQSTICDWKRKKTNPAADKLMVICDALQVSPYELLSGTESGASREINYVMVDKASSDYFLLERYHALPQAARNRVLGYLEALQTVDRTALPEEQLPEDQSSREQQPEEQ